MACRWQFDDDGGADNVGMADDDADDELNAADHDNHGEGEGDMASCPHEYTPPDSGEGEGYMARHHEHRAGHIYDVGALYASHTVGTKIVSFTRKNYNI